MTVLVCGGRDYDGLPEVYAALDALLALYGSLVVVQGGARGADAHARAWTATRSQVLRTYPANWELHGRKAGVLRNQEMLDKEKPDLVLAFPGGRGTADMVRRAKDAGVPVSELRK